MHVYEHNQSSKVPSVYLVEINMCLPMHACVLCLAKKNLVFVRDLADTNNQVACLFLVVLKNNKTGVCPKQIEYTLLLL